MIELKGKYNNCKVFTDNIDSETISQLTNLLNQEFVSGGQIRIMPDTHAGKGCVIGTTMTITDKVVPNLVGVDIGCFQGDTKVWTSFGWIKIKELINKGVFTVDSYDTETKQFVMGKAVAKKTRENAELVKVVYNTVSIFNKQRYEVLCTPDHKFLVKVSDDNEQWIEAKNLERDMKLAQEHAKINRETIAKQILKYAKLTPVESFDTIHNYIDVDNMILRKGSISAQAGEKVIIPMNMRDGSLICVGKGNADWNYSAPHGAGRILSRSKAKDTISMTEYQESMKGIYTTSVNKGTIDESPFVYKPIEEIMENIKDTVEIIDIIKPVYNFKAGE